VVKLLDYAGRVEELERDPNPFAAVVLAHLKALETQHDPEARRVWKVRLIKGLYERGLDQEDIRRLFRLIDWMMTLPKDLERAFWAEIEEFEEDRKMPYITSVERLGIEKGRKVGEKKGEKRGLLRGIRVGLSVKFGEHGSRFLGELRAVRDNKLLERVLDSIPAARSLDDLRQIVADGSD
jgi:hypothetical protein